MTTAQPRYYLVIAITALSFFSCQKGNKTQLSQLSPGTGNGSVSGLVTDLNNTPLINATIVGGTATTTTDADGKFTLTKVQFTADTVLVNVTKEGFFQASKNFGSTAGTVSNAKIQLIPKPASATVTASSGGKVSISGGGSIDFTGGFVNASNGNAYTGDVSISTFYLNPTDQNFSASAPGDLKGVSATNQQGVLQSFGVVAVELNDASGNKIQLATGKTAAITLPIPAALVGKAPLYIPLWYFDNGKGAWKQEGIATKQGTNYVGIVNHFSFWSAGDLMQSIKLSMSFTLDTTGIAYANKLVTISKSGTTSNYGYTDSAGTVNGSIPVNEVLTMKVFDDCGENVYTKNIGPFGSDTVFKNEKVARGSCASLDTSQYIKLSIKGKNYSWPSSHIRESFQPGSSTFIMGTATQITPDSSIIFEGTIFTANTSPGSYPIGILITINGTYTYQAGGMAYDPNYPYPTTNITKYDAVGTYIEGSISGWIKTFPSTATADSFPLSGSYRVKRIQ